MNFREKEKKSFKINRKYLIGFSILVLGIISISTPKKAEAIFVPVFDAPNFANTEALVQKEFTLDSIVTAASKVVISNITTSIVNWINSGFQGGPAFVSNPGTFFTDLGDQVAGDFIAGTELGFMCEPFELDIRAALNFGYNSTFVQRNYCRLSDIVSNTENFAKFTSGDFTQGGWDSWFEITQNPENNPLGAYWIAESEVAIRTARQQELARLELDWGHGFLSSRECILSDVETHECLEYKIITPGSVIEEQLNQTLGTGLRQLEIADEINEIVGALIGQLAKTVLSNVGLAGVGPGGRRDVNRPGNSLNPPFVVSCYPDRTNAVAQEDTVTWTSFTYDSAPGTFAYLWSGNGQSLNGATTQTVSIVYTEPGLKRAAVRVTKGQNTVDATCSPDVQVEPRTPRAPGGIQEGPIPPPGQ